MISIRRDDYSAIRIFGPADGRRVEFHARYGFVSPESKSERERIRRYNGAAAEDLCEFEFEIDSLKDLKVVALRGCQAKRDGDLYCLTTPRGEFIVGPHTPTLLAEWKPDPEDTRAWIKPFAISAAAILFILLLILQPSSKTEVAAGKNEELAPVVIRTIAAVPAPQPTQAPDPKAQTKKAVSQKLGFLSLLGRKDFKKVTGGMKTAESKASAGAGAGEQGSGGELLAGMGQGLHKTTVGNTGVSGLGGVGTKGAGGGLGGYGDTEFGGAGGATLSAIPLTREATIDEGLDRAQIQAAIMRYLSQVRACYEEGLKRNQALIGQITMGFEIAGSGNLNYARVQRSSLGDRPVEDCVQTKMMNWKFPQPRGGVSVKVSYPFMLRPVRS